MPDRHGWNSIENYRQIHEERLANHPFLDHSKGHTVSITEIELGERKVIKVEGEIYCRSGVVLEVDKYLHLKYIRGRAYVRGFSYRNNAYLPGKHNVLRYDNAHDPEGYHRHAFDLATGTQVGPPHFSDTTAVSSLIRNSG